MGDYRVAFATENQPKEYLCRTRCTTSNSLVQETITSLLLLGELTVTH